MLRLSRFLVAGAVLAIACVSASAQDLGVGMKAPKLEVAKWFKGQPVKLGDGKSVNVVEFWATW